MVRHMDIIDRVGYPLQRIMDRYSAVGTAEERESAVNAMAMQVASFDGQWPLLAHIFTANGDGSSDVPITCRNQQSKKEQK